SLTRLIIAAAQKADWQLAISTENPPNKPVVIN
ncbi:MAG: hypothetical protein ACJAX5_001473, partial [Patiriisocius sp.]